MEDEIVTKNIHIRDPRNRKNISVPLKVQTNHLCRTCNESPRFYDLMWCWPCAIKQINNDRAIREFWHNLRNFLLFGKQISDRSFNLAEFGSKESRDTFRGNFNHCHFIGTTFTNIDFGSCEFEDVDFTGATFINCLLIGTSFKDCLFDFVKFERVNLSNSGFQGNKFKDSLFHKKNSFAGSSFEQTSFCQSIFDSKVKFNDANLTSVSFEDCYVAELDLSSTNVIKNIKIFGGQTKIKKIRLQVAQRKEIFMQKDLMHNNVQFDIPVIRTGNDNKITRLRFPLWSEYNQIKDYFNVFINSLIYVAFAEMIFCVFRVSFNFSLLLLIFISLILLGIASLIHTRLKHKKKLIREFGVDINQVSV